jgi:hypothetical protein
MYQFRIRLYPELLKTRENLHLDSSLEDVKKIAEDYNDSGMKAVNKKEIEVETIEIKNGDTIEFVLTSEAWLQFPTKAIRSFISKLSKMKPYSDLITPNGRLFRGEFEFLENANDDSNLQRELSDEETLVEVTRLFFRETEENRNKINLIKKVLGGSRNE